MNWGMALSFLHARLREPSTYATISTLLLMVGVNVASDHIKVVVDGLVVVVGFLGILLRERGGEGE